jgi:hypothetical protein
LTDLHRWLNLLAHGYGVKKVDLLAEVVDVSVVENLLAYAREFQVGVSLRTSGSAGLPDLGALAAAGLVDVLLTPGDLGSPEVAAWLSGCSEAGLPMRLEVGPGALSAGWVELVKTAGVRVVTVTDGGLFTEWDARQASSCERRTFSRALFKKNEEATRERGVPREAARESCAPTGAATRERGVPREAARESCAPAGAATRERGVPEDALAALEEGDVEVNLLVADASEVPEAWRGHVVDPVWQHLEPAFYHREALAWAVARFEDSPRRVRALSLLAMTRLSRLDNPVDGALMLFLVKYLPALIAPLVFVTKGFRLLRWRGPVEVGTPPVDAAPGAGRKRYLDAVDARRVDALERRRALADRAGEWQRTRTVDRVFESTEWTFRNAFFERLLGVNKIRTVSSRAIHGSRLPWLEVPFMVTATFGGGLAEGIGFGAGRHLRLCCPMVDTTHQITLFVDEQGDYVLLRDGQVVTPLDYGGRFCVPWRFPDAMHLHIQAFNVDESLAVTSVRVWEGERAALVKPEAVKWSVVVFSTRFARRLQAALLALAHQRDIDLSALEVIVGYVPGVDGTEDTLDSVRLAHPELRIVHAAFPEHNLKSKGFVLNEAMALASGSWITILDSDIILPPDFFATLAREAGEAAFLAPAGRAMLDAAQTARVLTGAAQSWEDWDALREEAPAYREAENADGVPVGYCQVFRRECLEQARYPEYDHFQGADYEFGAALIRHHGPVKRLGLPVLHLHHGGRQWYGTQKHY